MWPFKTSVLLARDSSASCGWKIILLRSLFRDSCSQKLSLFSFSTLTHRHLCYLCIRVSKSWVIFHFASTVALCYCFFCVNGISCSFSATVTPRCRRYRCFSELSFLPQIVGFGHIISFELLGKPSTQILFLLTHFVISCISLLNVFSADSLFISLKIDFSRCCAEGNQCRIPWLKLCSEINVDSVSCL